MSIRALSFPPKILAAPLSTVGTRLILPDINGWDGNALTSGEVGTVIYATLQNFSRTTMEIVELDATTLSVATTTGILINKRGLSFVGGTSASAETPLSHSANETIVQLGTNAPQLYENLVDLDEAQTITAVKTFNKDTARPKLSAVPATTTTVDEELITRSELAATALASAVAATETAAGYVEKATAAQGTDGTATGETSAPLFMSPDRIASQIQSGSWQTFTETASGDDAYTGTTTPSCTPAAGSYFFGSVATANTAGCTLGLNGETPVAIQKVVSGALGALETGDIIANVPNLYYRNASVYILLSPLGSMPSTALLTEMATFFAATAATGANVTSLTDGSNADALHIHATQAVDRIRGKQLIIIDEDTAVTASAFSATLTVLGLSQSTSGGGSQCGHKWTDNTFTGSWTGSRSIDSWMKVSSTSHDAFVGMGLATSYSGMPSNHTTTERHVGFFVDGSSVYASCADGTTQTVSSALSGVTVTDMNQYRVELDSGTTARFYVNGVLKATLTTNLPTGTTDITIATVTNNGTSCTTTHTYPVCEVTPT